MAYELNPQQNEDDENQNQITGQGGGSLISGGGDSSLAAGAQAAPSGQPFTNVKDYLDANRTQAEGLAGKISGNIKSQGDAVRGQISQAGTNFNTAADAKTVKMNQGLVDQAKNDSANFVKDQNNVQQFGQLRDANYTGPKDLTDYNYSGLQQSAKSAVQKGALVDTDGGRNQLIAEVSKRPTAGTNALNNLLLTGQPTAMNTLQSAKTGVSDLSSYLDSVNASAMEKAKLAQAETQATKDNVYGQFKGDGGLIPTLYGNVDKRVSQLQGEANTLNQSRDLFSQGKVGELSDQQLAALGVKRGEVDSFQSNLGRLRELGKDFNVSNYIKTQAPDAQITKGNAVTRDELARLQALESLFGGQSQIEDSDRVGTANSDLVDFDKQAYSDLTSMLRNAEIAKAGQDIGGFYYENIGQHTGQGHAGGFAGRDTAGLVAALLNQGRGLNEDETNQYFNNYGRGNYIGQFNDQLNQARARLGQASIKQ